MALNDTLKLNDENLDFLLDEGMFLVEDIIPGVSDPLIYIGVAEKGQAMCCSEPLRGAVLGAKVERGRRLERGPNEHRRGPGQVEGVGGTMTGIMGFPGNL